MSWKTPIRLKVRSNLGRCRECSSPAHALQPCSSLRNTQDALEAVHQAIMRISRGVCENPELAHHEEIPSQIHIRRE